MLSTYDLDDLAKRFNLPTITLSEDKPFVFILGDKYHFTLEYNQSEDVILSLAKSLAPYDEETLAFYVKKSSYLEKSALEFSVGYAKDCLYLMVYLKDNASSVELINVVLGLIELANLKE